MIKSYNNNNSYWLPIKIGMEVIPISAMGCFYNEEEIDKCMGYTVSAIKIYKDNKVYFDIEKNKDNLTTQIPLNHLGIFYFLNQDDAIQALRDIKKKKDDGTLDEWLDSIL